MSEALRTEEESGDGKAVAHMPSERDLLKSALRWCLENGILLKDGHLLQNTNIYYGIDIQPPAHLATLIAEVLKQ